MDTNRWPFQHSLGSRVTAGRSGPSATVCADGVFQGATCPRLCSAEPCGFSSLASATDSAKSAKKLHRKIGPTASDLCFPRAKKKHALEMPFRRSSEPGAAFAYHYCNVTLEVKGTPQKKTPQTLHELKSVLVLFLGAGAPRKRKKSDVRWMHVGFTPFREMHVGLVLNFQ